MASSLPQYMKAVQLRSRSLDKDLKINLQTPLPKTAKTLKKDTALVKVAYASLNPVDYKVLESPVGYVLTNIPAADYAGTVVESKLPHVKAGDRVFGATATFSFGTLAEYTVVPKAGLARAPEGVKLEDLATVGIAGLTAYQSVAPFVKSGDQVLINGGSGGVGTFAIQIAKALGCSVTATCSGANVDLCKSLGADEVIDYRAADLIETLVKGGKQYDFIFDTVFYNPTLYWQSHQYLKQGGTFATIGGNLTFKHVSNLLAIFLVPSWLGGGLRPFKFIAVDANAPDFEKVGELMQQGKVKPVIESVLELEDTSQGYARIKSSRTRGKIVVKVTGE